MSNKTYMNKKIRKVVRRRFDERFEELIELPFWKRLSWAWKVVRGRK